MDTANFNLPRNRNRLLTALLVPVTIAATGLFNGPASAQEAKVLNLYSARHYQTDEAMYANFTKQTGIRINRIEAGDEALLERLRNEGKGSPADVVLLVDAARLWRAQIEGLFQPVQSKLLQQRIPEYLRGKDDGKGSEWFGFSTRARVIVYNKANVDAKEVQNYEDLARPSLQGQGLHPHRHTPLHAVADRRGLRAPGRGVSRAVGARRGRQLRALASRRRHRPDQGGRQR